MQTPPLIGQVLSNQFRIQRQLGVGGMGAVYLAEQLDMERPVVVKVLHPELTAGSPTAVERFKREAKAVARLNHPHVVQVHVFGTTETGQLYLVMEYVEGHTLADCIASQGRFPEARALKVLDQMCSALTEAHGAGLVHRDLKPENVMLTNRFGNPDYVKVLDFGIARMAQEGQAGLTKTGSVFGTPRYMAPEQARGKKADARSDLYAMGVLLWVMLTAEHPFGDTDSAVDYLIKHATQPIPSPLDQHPDLPLQPRTDRMLARLVAKDPDARFQSSAELQREVRTALRDLPDHVRNAPTPSMGVTPPPQRTAAAQTFDASVLDHDVPAPVNPTFITGTMAPEGESAETETPAVAPPQPSRPPWLILGVAAMLFVSLGAGAGIWFARPDAVQPIVAPAPSRIAEVEHHTAHEEPEAAVELVVEPEPKAASKTASNPDLPKAGEPWRGVPVPANVSLSSSSTAGVVYETELSGESLLQFYEHHLGQYQPQRFVGGIQFRDPRAPLSTISITMSAMGRLLILSPNTLVMSVEKTKAGETMFGLPVYPGAVETSLTTISAIYSTSAPVEDVMAYYREKIQHQSGLMFLDNLQEDDPRLIITNQNAADLPWKMLNVSVDNNVVDRKLTRIMMTRKRE